ncbi:hypothetical protein BLA29_011381 [Euroglyphus maynei]|uniref:Uncharacterized protein n=1 Tax=Euroglyphus maynei TaxID=6958 RepID=A0A1Y3B6C8_EURMA|nr:hypothetical protein BLA29_011381 [Euroglyphus maynei]
MEPNESNTSRKKPKSPPPKYIRSTPYLRLGESSSLNRFERQNSPPKFIQSRLKRPSDKYTNLDDICCIALICNEHQRIGLIDIPQKGLFFPSLSCRMSNYSVNSIVREMLNRIFGDVHVSFIHST